jgi:hypothetical protein
MKPSLFIASSAESVNVAFALQENLDSVAEVTVWNQGVFNLSKFALESLIDILEVSDFGLFVFAPDDVVSMRGTDKQAVRDNVLFELGLFIGRLGRERNFVVLPKSTEGNFRLPSDLLGLMPALYESNRQDGNLHATLGPASSKIMKSVAKLGPVQKKSTSTAEVTAVIPEPINYSDADKLAILESWMGYRPSNENTQVIHFAEVDLHLRLPAGTTKLLIKQVARRWDYVVQHEGELTILFRQEHRPVRRSTSWAGY